MKAILVALAASVLMASCTQNLEQVADTNRQTRMEKANANLPLTSGAADGLGNFIAQKYDDSAPPPASTPSPAPPSKGQP